MSQRPIAFLFIVLVLGASLSSCGRERASLEVRLPATPLLSEGPGWLVVEQAYIRVKASPSFDSGDVAHLRRGDVVRVEARVFGSPDRVADSGVWFRIKLDGSPGWVHSSLAILHPGEEEARKAAGVASSP